MKQKDFLAKNLISSIGFAHLWKCQWNTCNKIQSERHIILINYFEPFFFALPGKCWLCPKEGQYYFFNSHLFDFLKCPYHQNFNLFSYPILYITQWSSAKEKFDFDKIQSFLEVLKPFKFAAILVHHPHQSSLHFEWVVP